MLTLHHRDCHHLICILASLLLFQSCTLHIQTIIHSLLFHSCSAIDASSSISNMSSALTIDSKHLKSQFLCFSAVNFSLPSIRTIIPSLVCTLPIGSSPSSSLFTRSIKSSIVV